MTFSDKVETDYQDDSLVQVRRRRSGKPRWLRPLRRRLRKVKWGMVLLVIVAFVGAAIVGSVALAADSNTRIQSALGSLNRVLVGLESKPRTELTLTDFNRLETSVKELADSLGAARARLSILQPLSSLSARLEAAFIQLDAAQNLAWAAQEMLKGLQPTLFFLVSGDSDEQVVAQISSGQRVVDLLQLGRSAFLVANDYVAAARARIEQLNLESLAPDLVLNAAALNEYLDQLQQMNEILLDAPELLTSALGLDGERSYLVLSQNSDELRPSGGYISTFGWMTVRNGRVIDYSYSPTTSTSPNPPRASMASEVDVPDWWINYRQPLYAAWDGSWYADFPSTAKMAMWYYNVGNNPQSPVDGVIAIDTVGFERVMQALQRVVVPGYEEVITPENFRRVVYDIRATGEGEQPHKQFIAALYQQIFNDWQNVGTDPEMGTLLLGEMLTALQQKHVMLYFANDEMNATLSLLGWSGQQAPAHSNDYLLVADANLGNKSNRSIVRQLTYDVDIQPDGTLRSRATITYDYSARMAASDPAVNEAYHGPLDYQNLLQVFVPVSSQIESTENLSFEPRAVDTPDHTIFTVRVSVDYDTSERFQFEYATPLLMETLGPYQRYRLHLQKQPGTLRESANVQITLPSGAQLIGTSPEPAAQYDLDRPVVEFRMVLDSDQWIEIIYQPNVG